MKFLRNVLDRQEPHFMKGGKLEKFYALYEMIDTFLYTPGEVTRKASHVRDAIDLKRMMITVVIALTPAIIMALYNTGLQANLASASSGIAAVGWRTTLIEAMGVGFDPDSILANMIHGALYFIPIYLVCNLVGGFWEGQFAMVRGHEINEGFLVTGMLFPLILPPTIPLWQVALGVTFGVVIGKEIFGGTGKNFLNPALTGRAFLFFAYPAQISGDAVWTAVDGYTGATPLGLGAIGGLDAITEAFSWQNSFVGFVPGSIGETSTIACIIGALILIVAKVGSWRIMLSVLIGAMGLAALLNLVGSSTNPMFSITPAWHLVLGGFAFGLVFMATDPVSASMTETGQWVYGLLIGCMVILIRVVNPAFPEGMMLAILFGNVFAPVIDSVVVKANIKRRLARNVQ
ncbi:MAG: NADH:ubiquinone reductase (Na(+)-transporting) subunit B [Proteobacteria bacterium]|nr:NADH:ubiquinone reductase (Na(+)-transporting) subunit B [Pseudomonadota bacterium]